MAETDAGASLELNVGGAPLPASAKLTLSLSRQWTSRGAEVLERLSDLDGEEIERLLEANEHLSALVARAASAAAASGLTGKRRLLGAMVRESVLDDATVDGNLLFLHALEQIEAPHVRCMESIRRAHLRAKADGEIAFTALGAEQPINARATEAGQAFPSAVLATLVQLHLLDASVNWDGYSLVKGLTKFGDQLLDHLHRES